MARRAKKEFDMRMQFMDALIYVRNSLNYVFLAIALFFVSTVVGFVFSEQFSFFDSMLRELALEVFDLNAPQLIIFIFQNNFLSALGAVFLGIGLGIMPIINALLNGAILGYVLARAAELDGIGVIWRLVPHGIFELPAIFLAIGIGIKLGMSFFSGSIKQTLKFRLIQSVGVMVYVILPLLVVAAIIEGLLIAFF